MKFGVMLALAIMMISTVTFAQSPGVSGPLPGATRPIDAATEQTFQRSLQAFQSGNYRAALPGFIEAGNRGNSRAQVMVGRMYQEGKGVARNDVEAARWFERAAAQGHRAAQYALGGMYEEGEGVPKDVSRAAQLYLASAKQGYDKAQFALGVSYEFGQGVPRNRQTAIYWLMQAGKQGDGRARWIADWLWAPDTPHLANEVQLGRYVGGKMRAWIGRHQGGGGSGSSASGSASGGAASGGGCGGYSGAACNAYKAGEHWAADRLQRGASSGSERSWWDR